MPNTDALAQLARSEANLRAIVEAMPDAVFVHRQSVLHYVNPAMVRLLGYAGPGDLLGKDLLQLYVHPDNRETVAAYKVPGQADGPPELLRCRWIRADGKTITVEGTRIAVTLDGTPAILTRVRDITGELEMQAALRESEARYRLLFYNSPLPTWMVECDTYQFLAVNEAAVRFYGYTREEFLALSLLDLQLPDDVEAFKERFRRMLAGASHVGIQHHVKKDRSVAEMDITGHRLAHGNRDVVLATCTDVTEARRLEEQLRHAQKMEAVGRLAGGVAHDFNNILAVILSGIDLAYSALEQGHPARRELSEVEGAARRAADLTRQLLTFSRQQPSTRRLVSLNAVLTETRRMLGRVLGEDVALSVVTAPHLGSIEADASQIEQVIMNLVVNARDAMPDGGELTIATENAELDALQAARVGVRPGGYAVLVVADTGTGLDAATRARLFEPFFTTKEVGKGTGLGLSTVFGIVKQAGGGITVDSEVGRGTTFKLYFPRATRSSGSGFPSVRPPVAEGGHEKLLVVEDDDALRAVVRRVLLSRGYEVVDVCAPHLALDTFREHGQGIDLVVTDLVMPDMDGRSMVALMRGLRADVKVLFMSGYAERTVAAKGSVRPGNLFIQKPFTAQEIAAAVRHALNQGASKAR